MVVDTYLDIHVHDREVDGAAETPMHALEVARDSGVGGIVVMPNTKVPLTEEELVVGRYSAAMSSGIRDVFYGIWMGLTPDVGQVKRAVGTYRRLPYVMGFKMYMDDSTGDMGVKEPHEQFRVFETLAGEGYEGPLLLHCEKKSRRKPGIFTSSAPISHCFARPEICETESMSDGLGFAFITGFRGKLHIAHISTSYGVELVNRAKQQGLDVSSGVCPHHIYYDWNQMMKEDGLGWKMNPALREPGEPARLLEYLRVGKIDFLETDHAPHTRHDKFIGCASGVVALPWWRVFEEFLRHSGFTEKRIEEVVIKKAAERFGIDVVSKKRRIKDRRGDYEINPWKSMEELVGMVGKL